MLFPVSLNFNSDYEFKKKKTFYHGVKSHYFTQIFKLNLMPSSSKRKNKFKKQNLAPKLVTRRFVVLFSHRIALNTRGFLLYFWTIWPNFKETIN